MKELSRSVVAVKRRYISIELLEVEYAESATGGPTRVPDYQRTRAMVAIPVPRNAADT